MTLFSVIIPCYNAARTLDQTVASLRSQSCSDWEAILVDDGSTDDTARRIEHICAAGTRFRAVMLSNSGPSVARNRAAAVARGRYLAFLDADDLWMPGKLAQTAQAFADPTRPGAVFGRVGFFADPGAGDVATSTVVPGPVSLLAALGENPACTLSNLSVRADVFARLGGFDASFRYAEDLEFQLRLLGAGEILWGIDALQVRYRASENGLSANLMRMHDGWRRAVLAARAAGAPIGHADMRAAEAVHLRYLARRALRMGNEPGLATRLALRGMRIDASAFLANPYRGMATLIGCLAAPILPAALRARLFS